MNNWRVVLSIRKDDAEWLYEMLHKHPEDSDRWLELGAALARELVIARRMERKNDTERTGL
jgi:hypothetical protein